MQNPFSPRSCSPENPQHLAHVGSQERYGLPWQLSLLRDGAAGFVSHRENTLPGFAKDFLQKGKIFTHIILNEREMFEPPPVGSRCLTLSEVVRAKIVGRSTVCSFVFHRLNERLCPRVKAVQRQ